MKKKFICMSMLILFFACSQQTETETTASSVDSSSSTPSSANRWNTSNFPLNLRISNSFVIGEQNSIINAANDWEDSVNNQLNFFNVGVLTDEKNYNDLNQYGFDNEFGVYNLNQWPVELPTSALAVTQLFGQRVTAGGVSYIEIFHADILVNSEYYNFTTNPAPNDGLYDFNLVMVHELGHFLGLGHTSQSSVQSVMHPSIGTADSYSFIHNYDQNTISSTYGIASTQNIQGSSAMVLAAIDTTPVYDDQVVKLTIELHADGKCRHTEDGRITEVHDAKLAH